MSKKNEPAKDKSATGSDGKDDAKTPDGGWRETIESILMAIVLALLFRGFVAEAFVIPTGSMAPTLMGRHKDVRCPKCNADHWYQVSASTEVGRDGGYTGDHVVSGTCPSCRYTAPLDPFGEPNHGSFSGDRIIVSKFIYDFQQPQRWDVIVFKYPGDATQNYIKRLVGLPNETVTIIGGNVYIKPTGDLDSDDRIARKPPRKLNALLQLVDDSSFLPEELVQIGWPSRWQELSSGASSGKQAWEPQDGGRWFACKSPSNEVAWLRYRHIVPSYDDWMTVVRDNRLPDGVKEWGGQLITDFYAYNSGAVIQNPAMYRPDPALPGLPPDPGSLGMHWVDDLAVECRAKVTSNEGAIWLDVIRAGVHHRCRINLADGKATLTRVGLDGQPQPFVGDDGTEAMEVTAQTSVRGSGTYELRLSNCDHEVLLWVNGSVVPFDGPTTYFSYDLVRPVWSEDDPGDQAPAGIGSEGATVEVRDLRIYRDKYYIAVAYGTGGDDDYLQVEGNSYGGKQRAEAILSVYSNPRSWETNPLFDINNRREVVFEMHENELFPLGDNSPHSLDGRLWQGGMPPAPDHFVHRDLLIGKALLIYWPHTWNRPIPFWPNFRRMGLIH